MLINLALPGDQLCQYPFKIYLNCWCCSPDYLWLRHLLLLVLNWNNKVKNCICNANHICNWNIIIIIIIIIILHCLPLHPKHKINIVVRYVYSKLRWRLTTYDISHTWVKQNLDSIVTEYLKRWLNLHQRANTWHLFLPISKFGIRLSLPTDVLKACQLKRSILKTSTNEEKRDLYKLTVKKHIEEDRLLNEREKTFANRLVRKKQLKK